MVILMTFAPVQKSTDTMNVPDLSNMTAMMTPVRKVPLSQAELTPPVTPNSARLSTKTREDNAQKEPYATPLRAVPFQPKPTAFTYTLSSAIGHGAWSTVYSAQPTINSVKKPGPNPLTPPTSPEQGHEQLRKTAVAAKRLARKDGRRILEKEARILTYLTSQLSSQAHLIQFLGFDSISTTLLMSMIPLTLEAYIRDQRRRPLSTATMFDPVLCAEAWCALALSLIDGMSFLQQHRCVHGDIKPSNILLQPRQAASAPVQDIDEGRSQSSDWDYAPLFCDFTSSHILSDSSSQYAERNSCVQGNGRSDENDPTVFSAGRDNTNDGVSIPEISAITVDYTDPELLKAMYQCAPRQSALAPVIAGNRDSHRSNSNDESRPIATYASDIFALAVTLLFAATGESPYTGATIELQKTGMAKEGRPFDYARCGTQASRIMPGRAVDRALRGALNSQTAFRWNIAQWSNTVAQVTRDWKKKGWSNGG